MERAIDTRSAVAINVITMVGIGPLITIPLVLAALGGSLALLGWIGGAVVALCDGLVWGELSSRFPSSGGTYVYLRESFGADRLGRALAFLFNWQFLLYAPCLLATAYIGFTGYLGYFFPHLAQPWTQLVTLGVGFATIAVLLRRTARVAATGLLLGVIAVITLAAIAIAALTHADWHMAFRLPGPVRLDTGLLAGFSSALYVTLYDYVGYADVALLGDEVQEPRRTIPRSIVISILLVAALYIALQVGILGVVPWHSLFASNGMPTAASQYVGSLVVEQTWGAWAARIVTVLVLVVAFASAYGNLLGFSRIPFAAARDGAFFPAFARLHPRKEIPQVALLAIGGLSLIASFFTLGQVIAFLTAGIVLVQCILQIVALILLRRTSGSAPFRMPLYPLPAIIALVGWILAFAYTGPLAIAIGVGWLALGAVVFLVFARVQRWWPFAAAIALMLLLPPRIATAAPGGAWATWHTSRIVQMDGYSVFEVDGKPFFVYGAAFFYERIPRDEWEESLEMYRDALHINTIDLYVPWNWQEPTEGNLDFTGRTNARRDLLGLLKLTHRLGFKIVLRPGPVIRNEWRNGGYPDWLLERPEYDMPLHDVLEGRYPATATLQNQHADAAAEEWLHNATHLRYASHWLHDVLSAVAPYAHDVIAVALDDDQGAYLDNDTWPAPHWHAYINWLKSTVRSTVGPHVPVFINTYEMKVTADSPVWAWGDWYQSDAYRIGEHDREQIDFSTAMLRTQPGVPTMMAEFQAGWLQGADENAPRPADPSNTALALSEFLGDGAHGIVNFPVQDTTYPDGWEVPWANRFYAWDAAMGRFGNPSPRFKPTERFGELIDRWGALLARTHRVIDAGIVWPESLFTRDEQLLGGASAFADATIAALADCHDRQLSCSIVDLRYASDTRLRSYPFLVLPLELSPEQMRALDPVARRRLRALSAAHRLVPDVSDVRPDARLAGDRRAALLLADDDAYAFLDLSNWGAAARRFGPFYVTLGLRRFSTRPVTVPARTSELIPVGLPAHNLTSDWLSDAGVYHAPNEVSASAPSGVIIAGPNNSYATLENGHVNLTFLPDAGATGTQLAGLGSIYASESSIGLLRDAVDPEPTPSARDYIAQFTHPMPAGTFNRPYGCRIVKNGAPQAVITCSYDAPDLPDGGAVFERTLSLADGSDEILVHETMTPHDATSAAHLKSISGFVVDKGYVAIDIPGAHCFGVYRPAIFATHAVVVRLCWRSEDLASFDVHQTRGAAILTLHFRRNDVEMRLGVLPVSSEAQARSLVQSN